MNSAFTNTELLPTYGMHLLNIIGWLTPPFLICSVVSITYFIVNKTDIKEWIEWGKDFLTVLFSGLLLWKIAKVCVSNPDSLRYFPVQIFGDLIGFWALFAFVLFIIPSVADHAASLLLKIFKLKVPSKENIEALNKDEVLKIQLVVFGAALTTILLSLAGGAGVFSLLLGYIAAGVTMIWQENKYERKA